MLGKEEAVEKQSPNEYINDVIRITFMALVKFSVRVKISVREDSVVCLFILQNTSQP